MANLFFPHGELYSVDSFIPENTAVEVGKTVLSLFERYRSVQGGYHRHALLIPDSRLDPGNFLTNGSNRVGISADVQDAVDLSLLALKGQLPRIKRGKYVYSSALILGAAAGGKWHVDISKDMRIITNLSKFPAKTEFATQWDSSAYARAINKYDKNAWPSFEGNRTPTRHDIMEFVPGAGIIINNLARLDRLIPHRVEPLQDRVTIRIIAEIQD